MAICRELETISSGLAAPAWELDPLTFLVATSLLEEDEGFESPIPRIQTESASLILLAHGSKDAHWRAYFEKILDEVKRQQPNAHVKLAFMEFTGPTLHEAVAECLLHGAHDISVLPLFLNTGVHLVRDVPAQIGEIEREHPGVSIALLPAAGEDARVSNLLVQIASESLRPLGAPPFEPERQ